MQEEYRNIYKTARLAAGKTQEAAAELLGVSVESVRAYETGLRVPPDDAVVRIYNRMKAFDNRGRLDRLLSIAEDNVIDEDERPELYAIAKEFQEIIKGGLELHVYCAKPEEGMR